MERPNRLALLIGIRDYADLSQLHTPYQDVRAMARMLKALGFQVHEMADGAGPKTSEAIRDKLIGIRPALATISEAATNADGSCVLFYFAGHGVHLDQIYMLDEAARMGSEASVRSHAVGLNELLSDLNIAQNVPKVVLLDCCQTTMQTGRDMELRLPSGLQRQTIIGLPTSPGRMALDGGELGHSPYVTAICKHFPTPGLSLGDAMTLVAGSVHDISRGFQNALHMTTLCEPLILAPIAATSGPQAGVARAASRAPVASVPSTLEGGWDQMEVEKNLHRVRVCKFRDQDGRAALYLLLLREGAERDFVALAAPEGGTDMVAYGRVLAREYGEVPSDDLCNHVERHFGPRVAARLRAARARFTQAGHAASAVDLRPPRSNP